MASKHKEQRNRQRFLSLTVPLPKLQKQKFFQKCDESSQSGCCAMFPSLYSAPTRLWWGLSSGVILSVQPCRVANVVFYKHQATPNGKRALSPKKAVLPFPSVNNLGSCAFNF